jgi:hypothetical protein
MVMPTIDETIADLIRLVGNLQVRRREPQYVLNLPNLRVNRITPLPVQAGVEIRANIANVGPREAGPFWVMTTIARNGQAEPPLFERVAGLASQTAQELVLTVLQNAEGQGICVTVVLDPPTDERPAGEVFESNEEDNVDTLCFFVPVSREKIPRPEDFEERPDKPLSA